MWLVPDPLRRYDTYVVTIAVYGVLPHIANPSARVSLSNCLGKKSTYAQTEEEKSKKEKLISSFGDHCTRLLQT